MISQDDRMRDFRSYGCRSGAANARIFSFPPGAIAAS
jgi:hypothetical protein